MMKRVFSLFLLWNCVLIASAQDEVMRERYEAFRMESGEKYHDFRKKANAKYADFMKQAWERFKASPALLPPEEEPISPVVMPEEERTSPKRDNLVPFREVVTPPQPAPQPVPPAPIPEQPTPAGDGLAFQFFGTEERVRLTDKMRFSLSVLGSIPEGWKCLSEACFDNVIRDCLEIRIRRNLGDWAYLCMLQSLGESFCGKGSNEATLLMAYLYCQSGYQMRLAMSGGRLYLLYASEHDIYSIPYFALDGTKFYPLNFEGEELEICRAKYPNERPLSLLMDKEPQFDWEASTCQTRQSKRYPELKVDAVVNQNKIDFFSTYPSSEIGGNEMMQWAIYANTPMDGRVAEMLYPALRKQLTGLSESEAVEHLLNWVQTGFEYGYDSEIWGRERAFFAEETLLYPYCDCEDRSILFTRLVRDLLGLKCLLVYYPGHLAAAVQFHENVKGDYILWNSERFVIADPTFIGAPVGRTMPGMSNPEAKVILLEKH